MTRKANGQFAKGTSGNPAGRRKTTENEKEVAESIRKLAPKAVTELEKILYSKKVRGDVKLKAIELVLNRVYGKDTIAVDTEPVIIRW